MMKTLKAKLQGDVELLWADRQLSPDEALLRRDLPERCTSGSTGAVSAKV